MANRYLLSRRRFYRSVMTELSNYLFYYGAKAFLKEAVKQGKVTRFTEDYTLDIEGTVHEVMVFERIKKQKFEDYSYDELSFEIHKYQKLQADLRKTRELADVLNDSGSLSNAEVLYDLIDNLQDRLEDDYTQVVDVLSKS